MCLRLSLKGKLVGGFISLAFVSLALALFCGWQLLGMQSQVGKLNALAGNTTKVLEIANDLKTISASLLHYNDYGDQGSLDDSAAHEAQAVTLLDAAAKATLSTERLAIYNEVTSEIGDIRQKRDELSDAVRKMIATIGAWRQTAVLRTSSIEGVL